MHRASAAGSPPVSKERQRDQGIQEQVRQKPEVVPGQVSVRVDALEEVRIELDERSVKLPAEPALEVDLRRNERQRPDDQRKQHASDALADVLAISPPLQANTRRSRRRGA